MKKSCIKYYRRGFLDGVYFTTDLLKQSNHEKTLDFLKNTLANLDYYAKKYKMNRRELRRNTKALIYNIEYFFKK